MSEKIKARKPIQVNLTDPQHQQLLWDCQLLKGQATRTEPPTRVDVVVEGLRLLHDHLTASSPSPASTDATLP